jgi:dihydrofolate reductase
MRLSLVVAASENDVIGRQGELPWRLSADLRRFKRLTMGHCLIMGRKTYESIGRALPGRVSIVLSRRGAGRGQRAAGSVERLLHASSLDEALALAPTTDMRQDEAFVIGGAEIYRLALPQADRVYFTRVHAQVEGDAFFGPLDPACWRRVEATRHPADEKTEFDCTFEVWDTERF